MGIVMFFAFVDLRDITTGYTGERVASAVGAPASKIPNGYQIVLNDNDPYFGTQQCFRRRNGSRIAINPDLASVFWDDVTNADLEMLGKFVRSH